MTTRVKTQKMQLQKRGNHFRERKSVQSFCVMLMTNYELKILESDWFEMHKDQWANFWLYSRDDSQNILLTWNGSGWWEHSIENVERRSREITVDNLWRTRKKMKGDVEDETAERWDTTLWRLPTIPWPALISPNHVHLLKDLRKYSLRWLGNLERGKAILSSCWPIFWLRNLFQCCWELAFEFADFLLHPFWPFQHDLELQNRRLSLGRSLWL